MIADTCGFYEIGLIRRAKQWHDAIIANVLRSPEQLTGRPLFGQDRKLVARPAPDRASLLQASSSLKASRTVVTIRHDTPCANLKHMTSIFAKPENVLTLCGLALADIALLLSASRYIPTLHLAKTSFWSGTKINQIRFGSYPDAGLTEFARAEAAKHAGTWDAWAFACIAIHPTDREKPVLLVDAGEAPVANNVRIIQELRLPGGGFGLYGSPRFSLNVEGNALPLDEAEASRWQTFLHKGIGKLKLAADNWERWSIPSPDEAASLAPR